jgi:hypothetical protein
MSNKDDLGLSTPSADTRVAPEGAASDDVSWLDAGHIQPDENSAEDLPGELKTLPVDSIVANAWNPNKQETKQFDQLVRRMRDVGMIAPIQVVPTDDGKYVILGGEHRWRAAQAIGWSNIPAIVLTDERFRNEDLQKFVTMQLNMISGKLDPEKFAKLYDDMRGRYDPDAIRDLMGFTDKHKFNMLTKGISEGLPDDMKKEFNKRASNAKNPNELQGILNDLIGKYGDDLSHNFMIFSHESREHIWVRLNDKNHDLITDAMDICRTRGVDINDLLTDAFSRVLESYKDVN